MQKQALKPRNLKKRRTFHHTKGIGKLLATEDYNTYQRCSWRLWSHGCMLFNRKGKWRDGQLADSIYISRKSANIWCNCKKCNKLQLTRGKILQSICGDKNREIV